MKNETEKDFKLTPRQGLIVYFKSFQVVHLVQHYGRICYVSRRNHYIFLYVNADSVAKVKAHLLKLHNVKKVVTSIWPDLDAKLTDSTVASFTKSVKKGPEMEDDD